MFSLSAQQSYSSLANSPAAILSACMQYSQRGYHKALLSSVPLTGFASILCQYHTGLTEPEYSTLTQRRRYWRSLHSLWMRHFTTSTSHLMCFVDAHAGAGQPTAAACPATQSHVSMWGKQTCFVCFHNLLVDHLRPSEQLRPAVQQRQEAEAGDKAAH